MEDAWPQRKGAHVIGDVVKPGLYQHYKDGRFYQVLWVADLIGGEIAKDEDVDVAVIDNIEVGAWPARVRTMLRQGGMTFHLLTARAHAHYEG